VECSPSSVWIARPRCSSPGQGAAVAYPVSGYYRCTRHTSPVGAPTLDPSMTLDEIRRQAIAVLPGVTVRRHLLWRYSLLWVKRPTAPDRAACARHPLDS